MIYTQIPFSRPTCLCSALGVLKGPGANVALGCFYSCFLIQLIPQRCSDLVSVLRNLRSLRGLMGKQAVQVMSEEREEQSVLAEENRDI